MVDGAPFSFLREQNCCLIFVSSSTFDAVSQQNNQKHPPFPKYFCLMKGLKERLLALTVFLSLSRALVKFPEKRESHELLGLGFAYFSSVSLFGISLMLPGSRKSSNL
ncbi:hypothetical protein V6N13_029333 [Hibiscus sabdariffa]|uniref:Uncharacterized protein n=2 Tax=Hibiscus sabdariffa TaxID=183260 RepID=A0ABR2TAB6_9ROSI